MSISSVDSSSLHVKPVVDLNIAAEANRIIYVLNKIIHRAKFVGLLGNFLNNDALLLRDILDSNSLNFVLESCEKYMHPPSDRARGSTESGSSSRESFGFQKERSVGSSGKYTTSSDYSSSFYLKSEASETKVSDRVDNALSKVIYLLEDNPDFLALAGNMENELSPAMKSFIKTLKEFVERMISQLNENSTQNKNKEKYLRETFEKNEKAKKEIERLEEELVVTKTDANVCLIGRNILINRHLNKIDKIQKNSAETIDKIVSESEIAMVNDWKASLVQQDRLKQDYLQASEKYSAMLKDHLGIEKVMRARRSKIENQVLGWIQKFDQEIGEKQAEEEEIQALLDRENREVNEIQSRLDDQEEIYDELMQEKAEYEREMLERRLYRFIVNRSARRIQRSFRMYKARRLAKKLARKGKKKK